MNKSKHLHDLFLYIGILGRDEKNFRLLYDRLKAEINIVARNSGDSPQKQYLANLQHAKERADHYFLHRSGKTDMQNEFTEFVALLKTCVAERRGELS